MDCGLECEGLWAWFGFGRGAGGCAGRFLRFAGFKSGFARFKSRFSRLRFGFSGFVIFGICVCFQLLPRFVLSFFRVLVFAAAGASFCGGCRAPRPSYNTVFGGWRGIWLQVVGSSGEISSNVWRLTCVGLDARRALSAALRTAGAWEKRRSMRTFHAGRWFLSAIRYRCSLEKVAHAKSRLRSVI
jgi:hypothetical protein